MTAELRLPAADVAEVRAELVDHLRTRSFAGAKGSRRRGPSARPWAAGAPAELGRQLRVAHQSTRRLLAVPVAASSPREAASCSLSRRIVLAMLGFLQYPPGSPARSLGVHLPGIFGTMMGLPSTHSSTHTILVRPPSRPVRRPHVGRPEPARATPWRSSGPSRAPRVRLAGHLRDARSQSWPSVGLELCIPVVAVRPRSSDRATDAPRPAAGSRGVGCQPRRLVLGVYAVNVSVSSTSGSARFPAWSFARADQRRPASPTSLETVARWRGSVAPRGFPMSGGSNSFGASGASIDDQFGSGQSALSVRDPLELD